MPGGRINVLQRGKRVRLRRQRRVCVIIFQLEWQRPYRQPHRQRPPGSVVGDLHGGCAAASRADSVAAGQLPGQL